MSDIRADLIRNSSGNGPINLSWPRASDGKMVGQSAAKAWVNYYNHTIPTTIRESVNVSTITDVDTGKTAVNLTSAMADTSYQVAGGCGNIGFFCSFSGFGTTTYRQNAFSPYQNADVNDYQNTSAIHGELA